jgi:uncharacterized damage-inducible protein DinB
MNEPGRIVVELLYGKGAHADPVTLIQDVSFESCARTVSGFPHSIWQIVWHMDYWMDYELRRIKGDRPVYPAHAAASWPLQTGPENASEWEKAVARFCALIDELARLAAAGAETLKREVEPMHTTHSERSSTLLAVLWQLVAHNSYHLGQIVLMQRAWGEWTTAHGDTW